MSILRTSIATLTVGATLLLWDTPSASARLDECGGVFVSADATCEFRETEECMTECKTEAVQTSCVAKLYTTCEGGCMATSTTSCESSCAEVCTNDCTTQIATPQPKPKNCMGACVSDCQHTCGGEGPRKSCCGHNCNSKCEALCKGKEQPPTQVVECTPTCTTACSGSCTAQANVDCQVNCQTNAFTQCETELVEECKTECRNNGGAIFCDGQFLNSGNVNSCAAELKAELNFDVDIDIRGTVDDTIEAGRDKAEDMCAVRNVGQGGGSAAAAGLLGMSGLVFGWRRRRASRNERA